MHKKLYTFLLLLAACFTGAIAKAQANTGDKQVEMADKLRADGKIYVVIAVLVIILLGIILYVARLDKKITRLEKESK